MRIARKLMLLALTAIAAMAMSASSASAQTVEVTNEHTGAHCAGAANCSFHAAGEITLRGHVFGIEATASDCHLELAGNVNEDGVGAVTSATFSSHAGLNDCTRVPCPAAGGGITPWPLQTEEDAPGTISAHFEKCISIPGGLTIRFRIEVNISFGFGGHDCELTYNDTASVSHEGTPAELTGSLHFETDGGLGSTSDEIEIAHL